MRHLALAILSAAVLALLPARAWALPFAGLSRGVCEPLANASVADAADGAAVRAEAEGATDPSEAAISCDLVLVNDEIDMSRGWAPLCDPSGASGAARVPVYDARPALLMSSPCDGPDRLGAAIVRGDETPPSSGNDGVDLGRALAPAPQSIPVRLGAPVADRLQTDEAPRRGFPPGVYRPPHA